MRHTMSAGHAPGATLDHAGECYTWPATAAGERDNMVAAGQTLTVSPVTGATRLGLLGAADGWGASGTATITYTDRTRQQVTFGFTDWTRANGQTPIGYGNTAAAQMPYRKFTIWGGGRDNTTTYVFAATFTLTPGATVASITLPAMVSGGRLHVCAVGTG